jgi:hypothetical protein
MVEVFVESSSKPPKIYIPTSRHFTGKYLGWVNRIMELDNESKKECNGGNILIKGWSTLIFPGNCYYATHREVIRKRGILVKFPCCSLSNLYQNFKFFLPFSIRKFLIFEKLE